MVCLMEQTDVLACRQWHVLWKAINGNQAAGGS